MPQGRLLPTCSTISIPRFSSFSRIRAQFHSPRGLSQSKIFSGFTHIQHWIVEFVGRALHLVKHNFLDNCRVGFPESFRKETSCGFCFEIVAISYVQASWLARHPGLPCRCALKARRTAVTFTPEQNMHRYLCMHRVCLPSVTGN